MKPQTAPPTMPARTASGRWMNHGRPVIEKPDEHGEHAADEQLALAADVEQSGAEGDGDGEAGEDQRRGLGERGRDGAQRADGALSSAR